ncbi:hypothetical protein DHEL01_v206178 [Diaporthe helianthi]|uniref:Zn(2)-C6 fungal-type domain-containing protein n=1 Tax=Diaporthe helianthi TaxID=158607 RepID=A0A2P5HYV3_DIAHE|nr:hypothetical protein DHEL01_v206178 [Diaporthe helianthi]
MCVIAQVKCTGELKGCARCNSLQTECVYEESRVGKVQSSRAKRRKLAGPQDTTTAAGISAEINVSTGTIIADRTTTPDTPRVSQDEHHVPRPVLDNSASSAWSESEGWAPMSAWEYDMPILDFAPGVDGIDATKILAIDNFDAVHDTATNSTDHGDFDEDTLEGGDTSTRGSSLGSGEHNDARPQDLHSHVRPAEHEFSNTGGGSRFSAENNKVPNHESITRASPKNTRPHTGPPLPTPTSLSIVSLSPQAGIQQQAQPHPHPPPRNVAERQRPASPEPQPQHQHQPQARAQAQARQPPERNFSKLDSKCVLACANILATLENYLLSDLRTLDLVLAAVRKASDDLKQLVRLQQESRCDRCIILFTAIMFQIIDLLEAGTTPLPDEDSDDAEMLLAGLLPGGGRGGGGILAGVQTSFVPSLGFGAFSLTSEEQRSWRSQIVLREYRHVGEILSGVTELAKLGPRGASTAPEMVEHRTGCLKNLAGKLKSFCERETGMSL